MRFKIAIAATVSAALLGLGQAAVAAAPEKTSTPPAKATEATETEPATRFDRQRQVCKKVVYTGSRLGGAKICKTQEEWDAISHRYRKTTEDQQNRLWTGPISR